MRVHLEERVAIAAPPEAVFAAVADWEGQSDWVAFTRVTADGGPHRVGERLVAVTKVAGVGFSDPMEVSSFQPPNSSGSIGLLIAIDVTPGLAIAMIAPLRITTKSDIAEYQVDEP